MIHSVHSLRARFGLPRIVITVLLLTMLPLVAACQKPSSTDPPSATATDQPATKLQSSPAGNAAGDTAKATKLLEQMVKVYRDAKTYEDAGELFVAIQNDQGQRDESPPIPFSVSFERPNKIRIHSLDANVISNGEKLRATINSLTEQVISLPAPAALSSGDFTADAMLIAAMRGQLEAQMPQLALLLEPDPIKKIVGSASPLLLEDAMFNNEKCHRIAFESPQGQTVMWISPVTFLLAKFEFPSNAFREKFGLAKAALWSEMKGARVDKPIVAEAFKMELPASIKLLKRFLSPPPQAPSAMLGKTVDDFKLLDYRGGTVTRESLAGKVVVLDMWATWCGWCFKGFPNLQAVYDQFKGNDKVAILAVNKDEASVTDEEVKRAFETNMLSIPIVRDQAQLTDAVFQVPGLPTMVILGPDGTLQEHHVGYDENLATTLPKKIERLLAGESLAKEELDKYNEARAKYDQQVSDALSD